MKQFSIGKLAKAVGISVETLRYYERRGLIQPLHRTESGYRVFDTSTQRRLQFIRRAQVLGFSLDEISELLQLSHQPKSSAAEVKQMTQDKIHDIQLKITDLERMRDALVELDCACLGEGIATEECPILAALSETQGTNKEATSS